ncbi:LCP family protein [Nonomuraea sp. NN258]|uniref:LCP family protein n=1 Tax=Nonomuraea antri TaxID=2730852 RepID=UPI001569895E|nr:LCP family protein [Nonomuraea antri]NRQ31415.1 LCP family protein [Nonomuraea antri]
MDDLKLLRDFGAELEHEPPASLVNQRHRFLTDRPRRRTGRRWAGWWTAGLVAVATAAAVAVPTLLINGNPVAGPAQSIKVDMSGVRNVLVIGSDTREGPGNAKYGPQMAKSDSGKRADTIVIMHLPADRTKAFGISVPRDTIARLPACGSEPARDDQINSAYDRGGAACLERALEKLTGIGIDHRVEVDFAGFKGMVDALGGVEMTIPRAVDDPKAKLKLPAGKLTLNGEAALGYARMRYGAGDGSDVQRIKRQQQLMVAMLKKAMTVASDPVRLKSFLGRAREAVTTDLALEEMYELATTLAKTKLTFVTVPVEPHEQDPNRLQWKQPEAEGLFKKLR